MNRNMQHSIVPAEDVRDGQPVAFDGRALWRMDAAAEQHQRRLAARNVLGRESEARPAAPDIQLL